MEKIVDSLFESVRLNEQSMRLLLGGKCEDKTGAGSGPISGGGCCASWSGDSFTYDDKGKLLSYTYYDVRDCGAQC